MFWLIEVSGTAGKVLVFSMRLGGSIMAGLVSKKYTLTTTTVEKANGAGFSVFGFGR